MILCFCQLFKSFIKRKLYYKLFKQSIKQKMSNILNEPDDATDDLTSPVDLQSLVDAANDLKRRKSPGCDNVVNEHIIFGGYALFWALKNCLRRCLRLNAYLKRLKLG